jgi:hypothetical protein
MDLLHQLFALLEY